jgi:hypothetical protein
MRYAMFVLGTLEAPPAEWDRYLGLVVDPAQREDWVANLSVHVRSEPKSVGAVPEAIRSGLRPGSWLDVRADARAGTLFVRGVMVEDDFLDHGADLAELFRVAANVGGRGELAFIEEQAIPSGERDPEECYLVQVSPGKSIVGHVPVERQRQILTSEAFLELARTVLASLDEETRRILEAEMAKRWKELAKPARSVASTKRAGGRKTPKK